MPRLGRDPDPVFGPDDQSHRCHAIGCPTHVHPRLLMCGKHWRMVPRALKAAVWSAYRAGQERDKKPSQAYREAARDAIMAVQEKENSR